MGLLLFVGETARFGAAKAGCANKENLLTIRNALVIFN
jgi:hypothetical protein